MPASSQLLCCLDGLCRQAGPMTWQQQLTRVLERRGPQTPALGRRQSLGVVGTLSDMECPCDGGNWCHLLVG